MQIEPFKLEAGDRVRCVNNESGFGEMLTLGAEYRIRKTDDNLVSVEPVELRDDLQGLRKTAFVASRFKPVVRVKAPTIYSGKAFELLFERSVRWFEALPAADQEAHCREQALLWNSAETELNMLERELSAVST